MTGGRSFISYDDRHREGCLALFDANCPAFFAPNERADYVAYLDRAGAGYRLYVADGRVIGAFGVAAGTPGRMHLNWIMIDPAAQGAGVGRAMMEATREIAQASGASVVDIAASHKSAPFFARFGARELAYAEDGWGPGMHRIDMEWWL